MSRRNKWPESRLYAQSMADYVSTWRAKNAAEGTVLPESERLNAYLKACEAAPHASKGTRRKWKRRLGL